MPIATGTLALKRFQILTPVKETPFSWIVERVSKAFISPIGLDDTREETAGFCHPFTGEPKIDDPKSLIYENGFLFALRTDKKKIPATYTKLQLRAALHALGHEREDAQGTVRRVGKKIRDSVKDRLKEELLCSTLPSVRLIEVLWHLDSNQIWLTSSSAAVVSEFEKLFAEAFSLPLVTLNPGTIVFDFERLKLGLKVNIQPFLDVSPVSLSTTSRERSPTKNSDENEAPLF
jgi:DNA recombination-dependent growth factor C